MGTGNYLRIFGAALLIGLFPITVSADELNSVEVRALTDFSSYNVMSVDSLKIRRQDDKDSKKADEKDKDSKKRPEADKGKDPKKDPKVVEVDPKRPNIREIPKARPKLRPGTVTDRVKVKRPPVRVKPGKGLRIGL